MADSRQYWMDKVIRQVVEDNMNPEVLSRDFGDPRFGKRPWNLEPESKPFMGDWGGWLDAVIEKVASAAGWLDEKSPQGAALTPTNPLYGGRAKAETAVSMMGPLRGRDLGATGAHEGDMYPGVPKVAGTVVGPAIKITPDVIKAIKRLVRSGDEAVDVVKQADQLKLPGTARTKTPKTSATPKVRIDAIEEALQADLPLSLYYKNLAEVSGYTDNIAVNQPERYSYIFDETMDSMRPYHQPAMKTKEQFYKFLDFKVNTSKMDEIHDVFREIRDYAQRTLMGEPTDLESFLPNTKWKGKPVERSVEPSATPTPKKEQKIDKLSREARQEEALENQGELFSRSPNYDRESIGMSQKQYDDLIEGGWDHQKIMDEHEIVSITKRREGAGPVRKVPKNPKPLTDEEYDLALGLEKDINKLLEVNELISQADETIDPKALAFYGIQPIKKMAKKIGWRGPVNEETKDAIFDLAIEKYNKLYDRAEVWNVDTHIWLENYITGTN